ncbi:hypothetical protein BSL78_14612 [Apostichopus japonicus]|uniref:CRIB domain-containing protein n=1 Tax=Stichopus japonicus TaxID=307972 RepID=A0A2G8KKM5_STIJA|nr:hypothetical protein BSL78_14612 [Apostichopus japonicus]
MVKAKTRRKRIDRSMIGLPQNFQHTVHLGSGDMTASQNSQISSIQTQMSSKGGYESNGTHPVELDRTVVDVQRTEVTMVICPILSDNPDVFSPTQSNKTVRITEARTLSFQKSVMCPIIRTLKAKLCFYSKAILEAVLLSARKTSETVR